MKTKTMNHLLPIEKRCSFKSYGIVEQERANLKTINQQDINNYSGDDLAMEKRLWLMMPKLTVILSMQQLASRRSIGVERLISITRKWNENHQ
jgi:glutamate-5-semialdehyde dehydrogenase